MTTVALLNQPCDRCGKMPPPDSVGDVVLHPFKLSSTITFRGRAIEYPWLCVKCLMIEKKKWWGQKP